MREQLIQYVSLLFAGAKDCEDIKQEILQNTLDRYDDLISEGKAPEAAYRLAITGIGDINEILGQSVPPTAAHASAPSHTESDTFNKKLLRSCGIALYILCPTPLLILSEIGLPTIGLCGTLALVAVATMLMVLGGKKQDPSEASSVTPPSPRTELDKSIHSIISVLGLAVYFILSFLTRAWHLTWLVFPLTGAVKGLVKAIMDLKEAEDYEN